MTFEIDRKIVIFGGKGGVGKTTAAAVRPATRSDRIAPPGDDFGVIMAFNLWAQWVLTDVKSISGDIAAETRNGTPGTDGRGLAFGECCPE